MQFRDKPRKRIIINITSLIDVLFLLLIFFMVSSTFIEKPGMKLDLPEASEKKATSMKGHAIYLTKDEVIFLDENEISLSALPEQLKAIHDEIETEGIVLQADENIRYGLVVEVMDIIRSEGIQKLIVATEPKSEQPKSQ